MRRNHKGQTDSKFYYEWLDKSLADMQAAKILLLNNSDLDIIAFHCQQSIEKALKGYLLYKTGRHFDGHNITFLCKRAAEFDKVFYDFVGDTLTMNSMYIETRYPSDIPVELSEKEVVSVLTLAEQFFSVIRKELYSQKIAKPKRGSQK